MFFETLLYYVFFSSSLFLYGVGINRMADIGFIKRIDRKVSIYNVSDYQGYLSLLEKFNA